MPQEGARNRERRLRPRFPEIEKAARRAAAKPEQGRGLITSFCSENKKMSEQSGLCSDMARPRGVEPPAYRLGEQSIALCMVRLVRWDVPNSLIYRGFCRMTLSCRDAQYHVFHSFSQRPISKILAKAKSRLSKNVPRWVSLCKLIITNPTLKNQGSDLFIG